MDTSRSAGPDGGVDRTAQLVGALGALRARISATCAEQGRDPRAINLIAVTKTYPASDVVALAQLGVRDVGENRDQEAAAKVAEVRDLIADPGRSAELRWHFLGRIQSRKCRSIAGYACCVHGLDRLRIVERLADAVDELGRDPVEVFVQVSLDGDPERGGASAEDVPRIADAVAERAQLRLRGLMAVAPLGADADEAFAALAEASARLQRDHPEADAISAGMSGDLEAALRHGATHLRVGSALLGRRDPIID